MVRVRSVLQLWMGVDVPGGVGAAFALHFPAARQSRNICDTLADDRLRLVRFRLAEEVVSLPPGGRLYLSAAHSGADIAETIEALERALEKATHTVPAEDSPEGTHPR